jgi:hypothetical membrane protein
MESTRKLLRYGVVAGPFFLALGVIQGLVREGFDFSRHALSHLANGPGGWVQMATFVFTGLMVIAAAIGLRRALAPGGRAMTWFLTAFGASMLLAALFRADPVDGFPVGTPEGMPTAISTAGMVHFIAGALGFLSLAIACLLAAREMSRRTAPGLARLSLVSGLIVLLGFFGGPFLGAGGILGIWLAVVMGWVWLAVMSMHAMKHAGGTASR